MDLLQFITLKRIGKALYGVLVALLLGEIGLTLFYKQEEALQRDLIERDPKVGFRMKANYDGVQLHTTIPLKTNSWGFRDREFGDPPAKGLRVLALGDSMVFGQGVPVEETYPRFLEKFLSERLNLPVEVINAGIPGYGTTQEAILFEEMADVIKPDVVLVSIAIFNDVSDNVKFSEQLHRWQEKRTTARNLRRFFRHNSQLYIMLRRYRAGVSGYEMMGIHSHHPSARDQRGIDFIKEGLLRLSRAAEARGIELGVVINPAHKQTSPQVWDETLSKYALNRAEFGYDEPNRQIIDFANQHGIALIDLLPVFRARQGQTFYFTEHWQAPGHELAARQIADFLANTGILARARAHHETVLGNRDQHAAADVAAADVAAADVAAADVAMERVAVSDR